MQESEKWKWSRSVMSDSLWPRGLQPTRLLCPWDFPGKSTGVGCHCLLQINSLTRIKRKDTQRSFIPIMHPSQPPQKNRRGKWFDWLLETVLQKYVNNPDQQVSLWVSQPQMISKNIVEISPAMGKISNSKTTPNFKVIWLFNKLSVYYFFLNKHNFFLIKITTDIEDKVNNKIWGWELVSNI